VAQQHAAARNTLTREKVKGQKSTSGVLWLTFDL